MGHVRCMSEIEEKMMVTSLHININGQNLFTLLTLTPVGRQLVDSASFSFSIPRRLAIKVTADSLHTANVAICIHRGDRSGTLYSILNVCVTDLLLSSLSVVPDPHSTLESLT